MAGTANVNNGFEPKTCVRSHLRFEWRKKWAKNWDQEVLKAFAPRFKEGNALKETI
ncbi:MAG: DUF2256 domain-containing protein [Actinomycetales bacterium]|nr:DUF2256 domain-containing protein [Actinomycetales bacterium]